MPNDLDETDNPNGPDDRNKIDNPDEPNDRDKIDNPNEPDDSDDPITRIGLMTWTSSTSRTSLTTQTSWIGQRSTRLLERSK